MVFYFVQDGETLYAIAKRYGTTVHAILSTNRLEDPNTISPGQALIIPRAGEVPSPPPGGIPHLVRKGETLFHLADRYGVGVPEILRANQLAHPEFVVQGQQLVIPERLEMAADWPMWGRTAARVRSSPISLQGSPVLQWSFQPRRPIGVIPSAPVVRYGRTYAVLGDGQLYALDRHAGRVKWRFALAGEESAGVPMVTPCVYDGLIYACEPGGTVHALSAQSGRRVWRFVLDGSVEAAPVVVDGVVLVITQAGRVVALEGKTGALVWQRTLDLPVRQPPAVGGGQLFVVAETGRLVALEMETGELGWEAEAKTGHGPVYAELLVLVGGEAFDPKTGQIAWESPTGDGAPIVKLDQVIYQAGACDLFSGVRVGTLAGKLGALCWQAAAGDHLVGMDQEFLYGWDVGEERVAWRVALPGRPAQGPVVTRQQVLYTLADGGMASFSFVMEDEGEA
ncbi:MAG TPA: PQQ-binding-like beta-propeller repeat protein [Symbiobacteriaceae bacterium]|nr:PQQ-binding-like beta-propeller repeat protein [Symbiobacteriaceae bacterium]